MKPRVFVSRPLLPAVIERIAARCEVKVNPEDAALEPGALAEACRDVDGLVACGVRVNEEVLGQATRLRVVANVAAGYDNIDVPACTRRGIVVTNTPGVVTEITADTAFALLLSAARRVTELDRYVREGRWRHWEWGAMWGAEVNGKTLGLYGFGQIGQAMARRAQGFSMRVLYHMRHRAPQTLEKELNAQFVNRETLLRESDFLSLHVPLTTDTHHMIGASELARMKPGAFLINTARGEVVDEEALVQALWGKKIAGAGLDVFEHEPEPHPGLLTLPNVVLLPHIGSASAAPRLKMAMRAVDNLLAALDGRTPPNVVNTEVFESRS
jgi:glyoxylate reductase